MFEGFEIEAIFLAILMFVMALLYSSVGHAGASGYLAAMALWGISPTVMKPTALALNIVVASIACYKFRRAGAFEWSLFWPLALTAVPLAFVGGSLTLPIVHYKVLVGAVLFLAAARMLLTAGTVNDMGVCKPPIGWLLLTGALLGFLSGLTGVGGGIFLSPLLLFFRWAPVKVVSGISAAFILVNSISGLLGVLTTEVTFHSALPGWMMAVVLGGMIGAEFGSRRLANPVILRVLAVVLLIAGLKMILI